MGITVRMRGDAGQQRPRGLSSRPDSLPNLRWEEFISAPFSHQHSAQNLSFQGSLSYHLHAPLLLSTPQSWSDALQNQHCWCLLCNTVVSILWELRGKKVCLTSDFVCKKQSARGLGKCTWSSCTQCRHTCLPDGDSNSRHPGSRTQLHQRGKNSLSHFTASDQHFEV